uniref:Cystatin domain-containing protein n=1 Tax=Strongyloides venezuelensis TaxID=75913 RepID=A0A0K0G4F3_STRVS
MNKLNVSIFIILVFLLATEAKKKLLKHHKKGSHWREKDPNDNKIVKLAEDSINIYNRRHSALFKFFQVTHAQKEKHHGISHYALEVLAYIECGENGKLCPEIFFTHVFDRKRDDEYHEYAFHVTKYGDAPIRKTLS